MPEEREPGLKVRPRKRKEESHDQLRSGAVEGGGLRYSHRAQAGKGGPGQHPGGDGAADPGGGGGAGKPDLSGRRFGRLTVLRPGKDYISPACDIRARWLCRCDCGKELSVREDYLLSGHSRSCGCLRRQIRPPADSRVGSLGFGPAMARARLRAGWSPRELARRSGVSHQTIRNLEQDRSNPSLSSVVWLADALGLSLDEYIGREAPERGRHSG